MRGAGDSVALWAVAARREAKPNDQNGAAAQNVQLYLYRAVVETNSAWKTV